MLHPDMYDPDEDQEQEGFWPEVREIFLGEAMFRGLMLVLVILLAMCVGVLLSGCAHAPPPPVANGVVIAPSVQPLVTHLIATSHPFVAAVVQTAPATIRAITSAPPDLKPVAEWTNFLIIIGILIFAGAVAIYFLESALHQIAVAAGAGGIALTSYSEFIHTTLWLAPYVSGLLLLFAAGVGIYEAVRWLRNFPLPLPVPAKAATSPKIPPFPDLAKVEIAVKDLEKKL